MLNLDVESREFRRDIWVSKYEEENNNFLNKIKIKIEELEHKNLENLKCERLEISFVKPNQIFILNENDLFVESLEDLIKLKHYLSLMKVNHNYLTGVGRFFIEIMIY